MKAWRNFITAHSLSRVSVPLRGNRRESRWHATRVRGGILSFPSPCGVIGVKGPSYLGRCLNLLHWFPSPCGVIGVKALHTGALARVLNDLFPSPCGVIGVKAQEGGTLVGEPPQLVSVPLRGNRRERYDVQ